MAADEARAERIRQCKAERPAETWASIADAVGVKERSALQWQKTGGISWENAKKLAEYFSVDADWLWRGEAGPAPDLMTRLSDDGYDQRLRLIEERLALLEAIDEKLNRQYAMLSNLIDKILTPDGAEILLQFARQLDELRQEEPAAPAAPQARRRARGGRRASG